jgi:hypothetical protein
MEPASLLRARRSYFVLLFALALVSGAYAGLLPWSSGAGVIFSLGIGLACMLIVNADSRLLGKPIPETSGWLVLLFWFIAAPAYAIKTRGLRGLWIAFASFVLLCGAYAGAAVVARWLAA